MAESILVEAVASGFPIKYNITVPDDADENFVTGVTATLLAWGCEPPKHVGHLVEAALKEGARPVAADGNGAAAAPPQQAPPPQQQQGNGAGWECPVHGAVNLGPGFRGNGVECKQWSSNQEEWTKDRYVTLRNGSIRWYCKYRSQ